MAAVSPLKGRVLVQIGDGEPTEVASFEVPITTTMTVNNVVRVEMDDEEFRRRMSDGFKQLSHELH